MYHILTQLIVVLTSILIFILSPIKETQAAYSGSFIKTAFSDYTGFEYVLTAPYLEQNGKVYKAQPAWVDAQYWEILPTRNNSYIIKRVNSEHCLSSRQYYRESNITIKGDSISIDFCQENDLNQMWNIHIGDNGSVIFQRKYTNFCMQITRSDILNLTDCNWENPNSRFYIDLVWIV